jgi:hypothetical protein
MRSFSQKHYRFVSEHMGEKPVYELAGIGDVLGGRLQASGFRKAREVLEQFLKMQKNEDAFMYWLKGITGANIKQAGDCYHCLNEWCKIFYNV